MALNEPTERNSQVYRIGLLVERIGLSRTTIWRLERAGKFPRHIRLSERAVG